MVRDDTRYGPCNQSGNPGVTTLRRAKQGQPRAERAVLESPAHAAVPPGGALLFGGGLYKSNPAAP
jgi:hypothetical protein